jgi:hypothetical protein
MFLSHLRYPVNPFFFTNDSHGQVSQAPTSAYSLKLFFRIYPRQGVVCAAEIIEGED